MFQILNLSQPKLNYLFFQDLGLGQYCCPGKNNGTSTCCDTNPNPTPAPKKNRTSGAAETLCPSMAAALLLAAVLNRF